MIHRSMIYFVIDNKENKEPTLRSDSQPHDHRKPNYAQNMHVSVNQSLSVAISGRKRSLSCKIHNQIKMTEEGSKDAIRLCWSSVHIALN